MSCATRARIPIPSAEAERTRGATSRAPKMPAAFPRQGHSLERVRITPLLTAAPQAKLTVSTPGDKWEREADQVADQVMRMKLDDAPSAATEADDDDELVQTSPLRHRTPHMTPAAAAGVREVQGGGQPLPASERAFFEPRFGADFSAVRLHHDDRAAETARSLDARAYTLGKDVVMGASAPAPGTTEGRRLLAHELTHVVQQAGAQAPELMRVPCQEVNRDKGGLGQRVTQDWFTRNNPGGGNWYQELDVPGAGANGGTGYADLVWDPGGASVYVFEMKKGYAAPADALQVQGYRQGIANSCRGPGDVFQGQQIRVGSWARFQMGGVTELPLPDSDQFVDLTMPNNDGVLVYDYEDLSTFAGNVQGVAAADRDAFKVNVRQELANNNLANVTLGNAGLAAGLPAGIGAMGLPAQRNLANSLWKFMLRED